MQSERITVCMATYNGGKFISQQIDSILAQSYLNWQLVIRDDGSGDNTMNIIQEYTEKYPDKIRLLTDSGTHLGTSLNFGRLMEHADGEYIMFSDQDDVWMENKIESTLNMIRAAELVYPNRPVLAHTDLRVVDSSLNTIHDSLWGYQKLIPEVGDNLNRIMAQNVVTGCTMMLNRKARDVSLPIPKEAIMYDWWIAINVARYGRIVYLSTPSVLYRQHRRNQLGAQRARKINVVNFLKKLFHIKELLSRQYNMVRKANPDAHFWSLVLNKTIVKVAQRLR